MNRLHTFPMLRRFSRLFLLAFLGAASATITASAAFAASGSAPAHKVLTAGGELAELRTTEDGLVLRLGGEDVAVPAAHGSEARPLALLRSDSGRLMALWLAGDAGEQALETASFDGADWSEVDSLRAAGEPLLFGAAPALRISADRLSIATEDGGVLETERQIAHVVWNEEGRIRYSPLVFRDGVFAGWNEIVTVSSAFRTADDGTDDAITLGDEATLLRVDDAGTGSFRLTLHDHATGRFGTLRVHSTPLLVEALGDSIHQRILELADLYDPEAPGQLADEMGGHIVYVGARMNLDPNVGDYLSAHLAEWLETSAGDFGWDLSALADASRSNALDLGRSVYAATAAAADGGDVPVLDLGDFLDDNGDRDKLERLIQLRIASDLPAPGAVGADATVHVSGDGSAMALSWIDEDSGDVRWIEGRRGAWSEVRSQSPTDGTNAATLRRLIEASLN